MNVLIIQHTALDSPGIITDFLTRHDAAVETIRLNKGHAMPCQNDSVPIITYRFAHGVRPCSAYAVAVISLWL